MHRSALACFTLCERKIVVANNIILAENTLIFTVDFQSVQRMYRTRSNHNFVNQEIIAVEFYS